MEPQDSSARDQLLKSQQQLMENGKLVMNCELTERAEKKYSLFKTLKEDICLSLTSIDDQIAEVKRKIQDNLVSKDNQNGLLIGKEADYLRCLEVHKV